MMTTSDELRAKADKLRGFLRSLPDEYGEDAMVAWGAVVAMDDAADLIEAQRASLDAWAASAVQRVAAAIGGTVGSFHE